MKGKNWHIVYSGYDEENISLIREILDQYVIPNGYTEEHDYGIYGFVWVDGLSECERALKILKDHAFVNEEQYVSKLNQLTAKRRKR